jgi:hypothetical protein
LPSIFSISSELKPPLATFSDEIPNLLKHLARVGLLHAMGPAFSLPEPLGFIGAKEQGRKLSDVFGGMVEVQDLDRARKVEPGDFPYPCSPIPKKDDLLRTLPTPSRSLLTQQDTQGRTASKGADIARGIWVAEGLAILVDDGLCKNTTQLGFG